LRVPELRKKSIAYAVYRQEVSRNIGVRFQFLAEADDVCIHGAAIRIGFISPD
jgi:hypothetical protein